MPKSSCSSGDKTIFQKIGELFNPPERKRKKTRRIKKPKNTKY